MSTSENYGWEALKKQALSLKRTTIKKTIFEEMDLEQALIAQSKYLQWVGKNPNHPESSHQTHLYTTHLLPRIEELQLELNISSILCNYPRKEVQTPLPL